MCRGQPVFLPNCGSVGSLSLSEAAHSAAQTKSERVLERSDLLQYDPRALTVPQPPSDNVDLPEPICFEPRYRSRCCSHISGIPSSHADPTTSRNTADTVAEKERGREQSKDGCLLARHDPRFLCAGKSRRKIMGKP
ncbi:uncharacterized protein UTRI_03483 [Ustilago trichophora]|uniref:Uncharacterized protein n=1 Tax=Ustilago trichophora TaxID=86804 RepID=A0A5C3E1V4_9BASI|nr:uncharacterized protein UTRI_03483 [Ustilago trichophora]